MRTEKLKWIVVGVFLGIGVTASVSPLFAQPGAAQPVKSATEYFVTGEGDSAHLWVREGTNLRVVGHGECKMGCPWDKDDHDHKEGDGHDHGKEAPKKPSAASSAAEAQKPGAGASARAARQSADRVFPAKTPHLRVPRSRSSGP